MSDLRETPYTTGFRLLFGLSVLLTSYFAFGHLEATPVASLNDKFEHVAAFLSLAFLLDFAWPHRAWGPGKLLPLLAYGLVIECVQYFLPHREFSLWDLAADTLGLALYWLLLPLCKRTPGLAVRWNSVTN